MTFSVNDRVALVEDYEGLPAGTLGTVTDVRSIKDFPIFVKFDQPFPVQFTTEEAEIISQLGGKPEDFVSGASMATDQIVAV